MVRRTNPLYPRVLQIFTKSTICAGHHERRSSSGSGRMTYRGLSMSSTPTSTTGRPQSIPHNTIPYARVLQHQSSHSMTCFTQNTGLTSGRLSRSWRMDTRQQPLYWQYHFRPLPVLSLTEFSTPNVPGPCGSDSANSVCSPLLWAERIRPKLV